MVANLITTDTDRALVGIGVTGRSVARHLHAQGKLFDVFDSREQPSALASFKKEFPQLDVYLGKKSMERLQRYNEIVLSPGVDKRENAVMLAKEKGAKVIGDIELFARSVEAPVIAITGSNAKSTVTTIVGMMAEKAGVSVATGGNLGPAALDLLAPEIELYVLELSSFQLELVESLKPAVACILNMSADHMDRYDSMMTYHAAKQRVYHKAEQLVFNREDQLTQPLLQQGQSAVNFGADEPDLDHYGIRQIDGQRWLVRGHSKLIAEQEIALKGTHNLVNILAAMAIASCAGIDEEAQISVAKDFHGLPHRSQLVAQSNGVSWVNDSKATNVGAVRAALQGLGTGDNIILIAGGQAKGQSFDELKTLAREHVKLLILIGEDARRIASDLDGTTDIVYAVSMQAAVESALASANQGDSVLLSPACASFDMFSGYEERGDAFADSVRGLI